MKYSPGPSNCSSNLRDEMSFVPPSPLDNERVHATQHEHEQKGATYSQQHPGEGIKADAFRAYMPRA